VRVRDVCAAVEDLAPLDWAYSWDHAGLNIGDPAAPVERVLVALSVTEDVLAAARRRKAQMIVSHHPIIWDPLKALRTDNPGTRLCIELAHAGIACYSAHTNLDICPGGLNELLAERLGLVHSKPLLQVAHARQVKLVTFVPETHLAEVRRAVCGAGAGVVGEYVQCSFSAPGVGTFMPGNKAQPFSGRRRRLNEAPERRFEVLAPKALINQIVAALKKAHPYEETAYDLVTLENTDPAVALGRRGNLPNAATLDDFAQDVRRRLRLSHVRVVGKGDRLIRTAAVIGGSGGGDVASMPGDVDVLVTGDVGYHDALTAEQRGLALVDAGHAGTEQFAVPLLAGHLRKHFKHLRVSTYAEPELFRALSE